MRDLFFGAALVAALVAASPGTAMALPCAPARIAVSKPSAAITVYSILPKDTANGEERTSGPSSIAVATDGAVWFTFPAGSAVGTLRDGKIERCALPSTAAAEKAFTQATGASTAYVTPAVQAALPAGGSAYAQTVAPNGVTWFTLQYIGRNGNPTNGGRLGSIDKAKHLHVYQIPGSGETVSIAIAKNGTIWLGDYYNEQVIEVDPRKL
jgi:streptogramin lyase